jgi:nucleotide-binding universal stress UspA family protein
VLSVVEDQYPPGFVPEEVVAATLVGTQQALQREADELVGSAAEMVAAGGLRVDTRVRRGNPRKEIVEEAKTWGADLVLVGSHGRTGLRRVLMGSVAQYVAAHAPCSVEVVRTNVEPDATAMFSDQG